jgi:transcriptional regulator with XRE-family HTH domain
MKEANSERFGEIVKNRRLKLGLTQDQVYELGGPSDRRQTFIEAGKGPRPSITTLAKLDRPLGWEPGSAVRTWNGGQPREAAHESLDVELLADLEGALARNDVYRIAARKLRLRPEGSQIDAGAVNLLLHLLTDLLSSLTDALDSTPPHAEDQSRPKPTS